MTKEELREEKNKVISKYVDKIVGDILTNPAAPGATFSSDEDPLLSGTDFEDVEQGVYDNSGQTITFYRDGIFYKWQIS